ncbi:MAG TPA: zf-HC2 domain-containing protein, partial [Acidimicrobiales bacterium]|nr:zf-HC2 domain-containing protein [Acidimicrobiales bacterium]
MNCAELRDIAPELALGVLPGQERAAALAHLQSCPACQAEVEHLTDVADELVALAPAVEPPLGFEQ